MELKPSNENLELAIPEPEPEGADAAAEAARPVFTVENLSFHYGRTRALRNVSLQITPHDVTAFIGPSGCGKSTLLRCLNRMHELVENGRIEGRITFNGIDILGEDVDVTWLRRKVGMVFQKPNPFPKSIFENVVYGLRVQGIRNRTELRDRAEWALKGTALWDEVAGRLADSALDLSTGQQQRLVIARAIAVRPEVILLDEPCSALDPISTLKVEELIHELKEDYTIVMVTHNMQQAARVSDYTAFMFNGEIVEFGTAADIFTNPRDRRTEEYITGRYG